MNKRPGYSPAVRERAMRLAMTSERVFKAGLCIAVLFLSVAAGSCRFQTQDAEEMHYQGESVAYVAEGDSRDGFCFCPRDSEPAAHGAEDNTLFTAQFADDTENVLLMLDGGRHELERAVSASGARYVNEDESIVYWAKGRKAFIEIDGEIVLCGEEAVTGE